MNKFTNLFAGTTLAAALAIAAFAPSAGAATVQFSEGVVTGLNQADQTFLIDGTAYTAQRHDLVEFTNGDVVDVSYEVINGKRVVVAIQLEQPELVRGDLID